MKNLFNLKPGSYFAIGIIVLLLIAVLILLLRPLFPASMGSNTTSSSTSTQELDVRDIEDSASVNLGSKKLVLPSGWLLTAALASDSGIEYKCVDPANCSLSIVSGVGELKQIVISYTSKTVVPIETSVIPTVEKSMTQNSGIGQFNLTVQQYQTSVEAPGVDTQSVSSGFMPMQISGCTVDQICINSGVLSLNPVANEAQVAEFNEFLNQLRLE